MFTLNQKKPSKTPNKNPNDPQAGKKNKNSNNNKGSKKVNKTVFEDPFYYRIQLLPNEDSAEVEKILLKYIEGLREKQPFKAAREGLNNVIKFEKDKNIKDKKSPLIAKQIVFGIKVVRKIIFQEAKRLKRQGEMQKLGHKIAIQNKEDQQYRHPQFTIIFYDEKKHQILEQLLCLLKITNSPYIMMRENPNINRMLGVRTTCAMCLMEEGAAKGMLKYLGKSLIDVPWLVNLDLI